MCGFIEDETRSGKTKRRIAHSMAKRKYSVNLLVEHSEYLIFKDWYRNELKNGFHSFMFPAIDMIGGGADTEYRFAKDSAPQYSNSGGTKIEISMEWEEC